MRDEHTTLALGNQLLSRLRSPASISPPPPGRLQRRLLPDAVAAPGLEKGLLTSFALRAFSAPPSSGTRSITAAARALPCTSGADCLWVAAGDRLPGGDPLAGGRNRPPSNRRVPPAKARQLGRHVDGRQEFLSGGIHSSMLVGLMARRMDPPVRCFSDSKLRVHPRTVNRRSERACCRNRSR
jgi:hypothetical protein